MKKVLLLAVMIGFLVSTTPAITLGVSVYDQRIQMNNLSFNTVKVDSVVEDSIASEFIRPGDYLVLLNILAEGSIVEEPSENTELKEELKLTINSRNISINDIRWQLERSITLNTDELSNLLSQIEPQVAFGITILRNGRFIDYWLFYEEE